MASLTVNSVSVTSISCSFTSATAIPGVKSVSFSYGSNDFPSLGSKLRRARLQVVRMAKEETVGKVSEIVRKQLALADDTTITGESKFAALGADSLDTVEIVMGLEEEFGVTVEEESAQSITTVQDAAEMIEKLIEKKGA